MIPGDGSRGEMIPEDDEPMFHRSSARVVIEQRTVQLNQTNNNNTNAIEGTSMDTILGRTISQESCEDVRSNLSCSTIIRRRHTQSENLHELNNDTTTLSRSNTMPVRKVRRVRSSLSLQLSTVLSIGKDSKMCVPGGPPIDGLPLSPACPSLGSGVTRTANPHDVESYMEVYLVEDSANEAIVGAEEVAGHVTVDDAAPNVDNAAPGVDNAASGVDNAPYAEAEIHQTHQTTEGPSPQVTGIHVVTEATQGCTAGPTNVFQEGDGSTIEESPRENTSSPRNSISNVDTQLECHLSVQGNSICVYNSVTGSDSTSHVLQGDETLTILLGEYEVTVKRSDNDS